jgi:hypothetical protein
MESTLNVNQKFADKMYRNLYQDEMAIDDRKRSQGIFCVGFHNWLNGKASALFIGEYPQCKEIITKQKKYIEKMLGFTPQLEGETYITFGVARVSDTVLSLSMALLPEDKAKRFRSIKADSIKTGNLSFTGIIDDEIGNTEVFTPIVPETGSLPDFDKINSKSSGTGNLSQNVDNKIATK